jgi:hypothetical protein
MMAVRGRADARWLPSRHHFALFRLFAFLRLRRARPEPREGLVLIVDRHQTSYEQQGVALWITLTVTCYLAATLFARWPLPLALAAAFALTPFAIHVPMLSIGALTRGHRRLNATTLMFAFIAAAAYFARHQSWARFAAWQFLALVALNGVAAVIVLMLRAPIARLERGVVSEN